MISEGATPERFGEAAEQVVAQRVVAILDGFDPAGRRRRRVRELLDPHQSFFTELLERLSDHANVRSGRASARVRVSHA
jgi:hypothetical protein